MMRKRFITVLGTKYTVLTGVKQSDDSELEHCDGYCTAAEKRIVVVDYSDCPDWKDMSAESIQNAESKTIRHEVIHAFLHESGLWENALYNGSWALNEEMVDWFARQWVKINEVYGKLGVVE